MMHRILLIVLLLTACSPNSFSEIETQSAAAMRVFTEECLETKGNMVRVRAKQNASNVTYGWVGECYRSSYPKDLFNGGE